jgi:hypothetical protein
VETATIMIRPMRLVLQCVHTLTPLFHLPQCHIWRQGCVKYDTPTVFSDITFHCTFSVTILFLIEDHSCLVETIS